ncbi:MAG TPA: alpha/beta fold hydrolase [Thermoanaerobaculia bacterium]|nr:alpha/beta fold hydrolase [Thermoanaerobaculia bacterium]
MSDQGSVTEVLEGEVGGLVTSGETKIYELAEPLRLESGETLSGIRVAYRTWGAPGKDAVLVCHALTGSANAASWWAGLFGPGRALDLAHDFIVCSNVLGSCYGTTGPASFRGADFPAITIRDVVRVQHALVRGLGIRRLKLVLGGSLGGMQVLEWALLFPEMVEAIAPIAVSGRHSAWCIGLSEAQRQALYADPLWQGGCYAPEAPPAAGLAINWPARETSNAGGCCASSARLGALPGGMRPPWAPPSGPRPARRPAPGRRSPDLAHRHPLGLPLLRAPPSE